jgi:hypothetical protein
MREITRRFVLTAPLMASLAQASLSAAGGSRLQLVAFETSPFPYTGDIPGQNKPFLDVASGERHGHTSPRGGVYWEDPTYSDRHVLLYVPPAFDPRRSAAILMFLHGNKAMLMRDVVARQQIPQQLAASGLNAVLVAPQFAVDALDSSAGRFWDPEVFPQFLDEAALRLAALDGNSGPHLFHTCPVILAAYSGGYMPASAILQARGASDRVKGVLLFDALYGEIDTFADWIARQRSQVFFFSAYSLSTKAQNLDLQNHLADKGLSMHQQLPQHFAPGEIAFLAAGDSIVHNDFMSDAWTRDPLTAVASRLRGAF